MNIIDLDDIDSDIGVEVKINGNSYPVREPSLKATITMSKIGSLADNDDEEAQQEAYERMLDMASQMVPDCPKEDIETLSINKIAALMNGISSAFSQDAPEDVKKGLESSDGGEIKK